ncbi:hypothetical protein NQ318_013915 [Aromia moschata]|uniref:Uncharacterized protein n=1 Tax=Aromia moschata TaxID=1265417 RepID=A0AAV8Z904_9CUCU|nr:hypothetical protein NQ318_013915 [Aromia moschata]
MFRIPPLKLLHSLAEDDASAGAHTPGRKSSRTRSHQDGGLSLQTSPKTPSHYSNASPPHRLGAPRDANGSVKSSPVDEPPLGARDEEVSLLPPRRS